MRIAVHGLDRGAKPLQFVLHEYFIEGDELLHVTDGQLRARVPFEDPAGGPSPLVAFVADHPDAAPLVDHQVDELGARIAEHKLERAHRLADQAQLPVSSSADQAKISAIVDKAVKAALAQFAAGRR